MMGLPMDVFQTFHELLTHFGPQGWWPRHHARKRHGFDPRFEVMVGAVLTQNTAWTNVERSVAALYDASCLDPDAICRARLATLERLIHQTGYFRQKAKKLKILARAARTWQSVPPRETLLNLWGIGRETADSILLYAYHRPFFVVDAYTRRLLATQGMDGLSRADYDDIRSFFESHLPPDEKLFNEYHALIVAWGKHQRDLCKTVSFRLTGAHRPHST
jgi:endonuclease-3 related protein